MVNSNEKQEDLSVTNETLAPTTRKRSREVGELQIGENTDNQAKAKRPRRPLQLRKRLEIIAYWKENKDKSMKEISKEFNVPRSTLYGIINDRNNLQLLTESLLYTGLTLERCSRVKTRLHILEGLLETWRLVLESRDVSVSDKKITAQAFEIHRMLSDLLMHPLPPCKFSSGWLKRFKSRHSSLPAIQGAEIRHRQRIFVIEGFEEMEVDESADDFTTSTIERWLTEFDRALNNRRILLLVDQATWNLFRTLGRSMNILIVKVPVELDSSLPMAVELTKEFKRRYYYRLLLRQYERPGTQAQEPSLKGQLGLIPRAWREVQGYKIQRSFKSFLESMREQQQCPYTFTPFTMSPTLDYIAERLSSLSMAGPDDDGHESRLSRAVTDMYPGASGIVLPYYLNQDSDTGPSSFLRVKVNEISHHRHFETSFKSSSSSQVRYHQTSEISLLFL
ncbi:hypothetical protein BGZ65_012230 [Modicella reniformis]|uniref:HTH CENPB-type domain-containing protein n=1 Tax=Modicella reniformis TaxID=1440133 RepID=A0A9P6MJT1_9FUNG|nr:hypothetical protein BGZ65_012230 [Modicella reniformis]